jgi:flagellar assembly protein FliH
MEKTMLPKTGPEIRRMEYRAALPASMLSPGIASAEELSAEASAQREQLQLVRLQEKAERVQELEQKVMEQESLFAHQLEAARKESFALGRREAESDQTATVQGIHDALEQSLAAFREARDSYLSQVEQEVVRLALSIAARVLHREAQMDPLLLSGAVRVALGQLADTTEVRLRVPAQEYELWSEMVRLMPGLPLRPQIVADDTLETTECALETHLGGVDLGVKAQLTEIERGFFDLLERRDEA